MENSTEASSRSGLPAAGAGENRRGFLAQAITFVLGTVSLLVPAVVGIVASLNPLRQKSQGGQRIKVTLLELLPDDGTPQRFPIVAERTDAWNRFPNEPIGAVFLRRIGNGKVKALNASCPHAGCAIQYHGDDEEDEKKKNRFACPCHTAIFEQSGQRLAGEPSDSPRPLDELPVETLNGTEVWVTFQNFQTGVATKVAKT